MTPLAEMVPAMSDADLKALRANAERLSEDTSTVRSAAAAEIIPIIDAETARRAALAPATAAPKKRAPAKKKVVPVTGHQTALPAKTAAA
jgi:ABC-type transporter MlaC component